MTREELIDEFEDKATQILESFLESLDGEEYKIDLSKEEEGSEYDTHIAEGFTFVYTAKGSRLARRMIDRLYKIASIKFPNQYIDIHSHLYREL